MFSSRCFSRVPDLLKLWVTKGKKAAVGVFLYVSVGPSSYFVRLLFFMFSGIRNYLSFFWTYFGVICVRANPNIVGCKIRLGWVTVRQVLSVGSGAWFFRFTHGHAITYVSCKLSRQLRKDKPSETVPTETLQRHEKMSALSPHNFGVMLSLTHKRYKTPHWRRWKRTTRLSEQLIFKQAVGEKNFL